MSHVEKMSVQGNPNIGLYAFATDKYCLVGNVFTESDIAKMQAALAVPVHQVSICGTAMVGAFIAGDESTVFVPSIAFPHEIEALKKLGLTVIVLDTLYTALGNIMLFKNGVLITNNDFEDTVIEFLKKKVKIKKLMRIDVADSDVVGSAIAITMNGGLAHPDIDSDILDKIEKAFGVKMTLGTVNWGSPYVRSGLIYNSHGFIIGNTSSGPEITNADEALGFVITDE